MKIAITTDTHYGTTKNPALEISLLDMKLHNPEVFIHCGDVSSSNVLEHEKYWILAREILGDKIPIITVMGNHDWWDRYYDEEVPSVRPKDPSDLWENFVKPMYKRYNIHHASENLIINDVGFTGIDGWYSDPDYIYETNDSKRIPQFYINSSYLSKRSDEQFKSSLDFLQSFTGKKVFITHFGITPECKNDWKSNNSDFYFGNNQKYFDFLQDCNYLLYGHSHIKVDTVYNNIRVINAGSDYFFPKFRILDI